MTIIYSSEEKMEYLKNAHGDNYNQDVNIPVEVESWYNQTVDLQGREWLQYLVESDGQVGISARLEYSHPESDEWESIKSNYPESYRKLSNQQILSNLEKLGEEIKELIPFEVTVGEKTGYWNVHELCIWFPLNTSKDEINEAFKKVDSLNYLFN